MNRTPTWPVPRHVWTYFLVTGVLAWYAIICFSSPCRASPLLPDLIAWENESRRYMYDGAIDRFTMPGRELYRFSLAIANIGDGPFEVVETTFPDDTQDVFQNIYDSDGTVSSTLMGSFSDIDPAFGHLFLVGLARYNLRSVLPDGSPGPVVATHDKTSFGVVDSVPFDTTLPGAPQSRVYLRARDPVLGVSIGWADLYGRNLPGQWIDVTGLFGGEYWLEAEIDPFNFVQETDDTNNVTRVLVHLDLPQVPEPTAGGMLLTGGLLSFAVRRRRMSRR